MIFGYARCSTSETKQDIGRQRRELIKLGATDKTIFLEYASGAKVNRPELQKLLDIVNEGDSIVTTEISRVTRSTKQLCDIIELCKERHLKLVIQNSITIDCSTGEIDPMTEAFLQMAGVFAQLERNMTVSRIKSGLSNAKSKGVKLGRPALRVTQLPPKVVDNFEKYKNGLFSKTDYAAICGISRPTLDKYIAIMTDQ
ncbi:hypothetical protein SDC9_74035 [bioreactor metagenome]|uniref:Resolvase/invertase-type recombinase catalytic domain-containing protein n=1 Tax=bioreactor metagenome TaxID=1076179 RepID=A0A644YM04_9ZZZZ